MKTISVLLTTVFILFVLVISLLLVLLNPQQVQFDFLGLLVFQQSVGLITLLAFSCGIFISLAIIFLPSQWLYWKNSRLQKKIK